jgi:hypothetical protein
MPKYLERPEAKIDDAATTVALPYGMTADGVVKAVNDAYAYLHALNKASIEHGYNRLEDLMQPAGFSGLLSNVFVRSIARQFATASPGLAINQLGGGRPDLVPRAVYPGDSILRGEQGVEVKASRSLSGWQGHNAENGWLMVLQFSVDVTTEPVYDRAPMTINRVMIAQLNVTDWNFSGRSETSRRTPTASVNESGFQKLAQGTVYVRGGAPALRTPRTRRADRPARPRSRPAQPPVVE